MSDLVGQIYQAPYIGSISSGHNLKAEQKNWTKGLIYFEVG